MSHTVPSSSRKEAELWSINGVAPLKAVDNHPGKRSLQAPWPKGELIKKEENSKLGISRPRRRWVSSQDIAAWLSSVKPQRFVDQMLVNRDAAPPSSFCLLFRLGSMAESMSFDAKPMNPTHVLTCSVTGCERLLPVLVVWWLSNDAEVLHELRLRNTPAAEKLSLAVGCWFSRSAFEAASNDAHAPSKAGCLEVGLCTVKGMGKGRDKGWSPDGSQSSSEDRGWSTLRAQIGWANLDLHT